MWCHFHLGLHTLNPGLGLRTLSFVWVYHPPSGVITRHYLGLCTSYHLFGFTHHIFSFGTMYPQSLFRFLRTLSFVWVYHPPLGVITCYYLGVCTPVSFILVYAPYIFFIWDYVPSIPVWVTHPRLLLGLSSTNYWGLSTIIWFIHLLPLSGFTHPRSSTLHLHLSLYTLDFLF
jgi:hypothetical protein